MAYMELKEGEPSLAGFCLGDIETPIKLIVQDFIKLILDQEKPQLRLVYPHTTGDVLTDAKYSEGFRPEDPLTLRLYLNAFVPDDGSSIQYDISLAKLLKDAMKGKPKPETMQAVYDELEKQMRIIKDYIIDYVEPSEDDEDDWDEE